MVKMCYEDFENLWDKLKHKNKKYAIVLEGKPFFVYCVSLRCFYLETIKKDKDGGFYFITHKVSRDKTVHYAYMIKITNEERVKEWIEQHKKGLSE